MGALPVASGPNKKETMSGDFLTDDLNEFLSTNDFAESAIHTPAGGLAQPAVNVILSERLADGDQYALENIIAVYECIAYGKTTDLTAWSLNDTVLINSVRFQITAEQVPDGSGMSGVRLRRIIKPSI